MVLPYYGKTINLSNFVNDSTAYAIIRTLRELNEVCPVYISLSKYIFDNNKNISVIEYETNKFSSKISRDDFINTQINL